MYNIALCDDEAICINSLKEHLEEYLAEHNDISVKIHTFTNGYDLIDDTDRTDFDLYILDVLMSGISGIETGKKLREAQKEGMIVYLSSSRDFALDAYDVQPFHYLVKPIQKEKLFVVLDAVFDILHKRGSKSIIVKTKEGVFQLAFDEIVYVDFINRACRYHLYDGRSVVLSQQRKSFGEMVSPLMEDKRFCSCGASLVVNLHYVKAIKRDHLFFKDNGSPLYFPKTSLNPLLSAWTDYWLKEETRK